MFGKSLFFILLLGGVAVLPYLMSDEKWLGRIEGLIGEVGSSDATEPSSETSATVKKTTAGKIVAEPIIIAPQGMPYGAVRYSSESVGSSGDRVGVDMPLPHLLSFQATPEWITQNWDRVTNRIGELDLQGWRVPYFRTGRLDDFAGSVTYYFDRARRVQRIVLHGYTSDSTEFVQLATSHYQMRRKHSPEGDLYVATIEKQPIGALQLRYAPLLNTKNKDRRCELLLEINRKGTEYGMSYEFERVIRETEKANQMLTPIDSPSF